MRHYENKIKETNRLKNHPDKKWLDRVITRWFKRYLQRMNAQIKLETSNSLTEEKGMLAQNLENWIENERCESELKGKFEGKLEAAQAIVQDFGISVKDAALKLKVPLDELMDYLNKYDNAKS